MAVATTMERTARKRRVNVWLFATIAVAVLAYRLVLATSFTGDDFIILHLLRQAGGLQHPDVYFHLNFFGYYRPVAFLSHALDWQLWGGQAVGFHLTSLLLHAANAALVFLFARRLLGELPAVIAALLFAVHPSSHEAVFWISSRFDLLATFLLLLALLAVQAAARPWDTVESRPARPGRSAVLQAAAVACFALALLSKESALAFPAIAAGYDVFIARRSGRAALLRLVPLLLVVALYAAIRTAAGGPELGQGLARVGKFAALGGGLVALVWLALVGPDSKLDALFRRRARLAVALLLALAVLGVAAVWPATAAVARPKLAFAAFAAFYLVSPVITLGDSVPPTFDPGATLYWATGLIALALLALLLVSVWRPDAGWGGHGRFHNRLMAFLLVFIAAALLPVSSMTEGKRYLYIASIGVSLLAGYGVARTRNRAKTAAIAVVTIVVALSGWQLQLKARDWGWAGAMTARTIRLVRQSEPDACRGRDILFLTAPVNVRDVYCNFYDYTFEDHASGCRPQAVRAVVRVVGKDVSAAPAWTGARTIAIAVRGETDRLIASHDLRHFDVPLWPAGRRVAMSIGTLTTRAIEGGQNVEIAFAGSFDPRRWRILYYSEGSVQELTPPDAPAISAAALQNWK